MDTIKRLPRAMHAASPYQALVLEHHRHPRNFGTLAGFSHAADGANALCGDRLRIELDCRAGRIAALRFHGESCAIAMASGAAHCSVSQGTSGHAITSVATNTNANSISDTTRLNNMEPMK